MSIFKKYPLGFPLPIDITYPCIPVRTVPEAVFFAKKNLPSIVCNTLRTLENNPTTLAQTEIILQNKTVGGLSIDDLLQVKHFGEGFSHMLKTVSKKSFELNKESLCSIHNIVGREEALVWGEFRTQQVHVGDLKYIPPHAIDLPQIFDRGLNELQQISDPYTKAVCAFMFLSKSQFFFDCNKRTALVTLNGLLLSEGICPVYALDANQEKFTQALTAVYEDCDTKPMFDYFVEVSAKIYPEHIDYGQRLDRLQEKNLEEKIYNKKPKMGM